MAIFGTRNKLPDMEILSSPVLLAGQPIEKRSRKMMESMIEQQCSKLYGSLPLEDSLNEIRIVGLLPARSKQEAARCRLLTTRLSNLEKRYHALSYVRGHSWNRRNLYVENARFGMTKNLYDPLLSRTRSRFYWIDVSSINQSRHPDTVTERAKQVRECGKSTVKGCGSGEARPDTKGGG